MKDYVVGVVILVWFGLLHELKLIKVTSDDKATAHTAGRKYFTQKGYKIVMSEVLEL